VPGSARAPGPASEQAPELDWARVQALVLAQVLEPASDLALELEPESATVGAMTQVRLP
jgi:hypothetical protein